MASEMASDEVREGERGKGQRQFAASPQLGERTRHRVSHISHFVLKTTGSCALIN